MTGVDILIAFLAALSGAAVGGLISWRFHRREVELQTRQLGLQEQQIKDQERQLDLQQDQSLREAIIPIFAAIYEVDRFSDPAGGEDRVRRRRALEDANVALLAVAASSAENDYEQLYEQTDFVGHQLQRRSGPGFRPASARGAYLHELAIELKQRDVRSLGRRLKLLHERFPLPESSKE